MQHLTTLSILSLSFTLTTSTSTTTTTAPTASTLPSSTANPPLTLQMYSDPACSYYNARINTLTNELPLSYDAPSPQYPFQGFVMTRNLTGAEVLTFYSSTNTSAGACGVEVGNVTAGDGAAGVCWAIGGATCYNLTRS